MTAVDTDLDPVSVAAVRAMHGDRARRAYASIRMAEALRRDDLADAVVRLHAAILDSATDYDEIAEVAHQIAADADQLVATLERAWCNPDLAHPATPSEPPSDRHRKRIDDLLAELYDPATADAYYRLETP